MDLLNKLVDDASYLQDEVEALKYVINSVPYDEKPGGKPSILEMVALIDHAQQSYFRVAISLILEKKTEQSDEPGDYRKTFDSTELETKSVEKVLNKIIKHRASIVSMLKKMTSRDLERSILIRGKQKSIQNLIEEMLQLERVQLRQVAERVLTISDRK
jgi:metal-responsive CopG/Arc/MetJ family transcriptional regulator